MQASGLDLGVSVLGCEFSIQCLAFKVPSLKVELGTNSDTLAEEARARLEECRGCFKLDRRV